MTVVALTRLPVTDDAGTLLPATALTRLAEAGLIEAVVRFTRFLYRFSVLLLPAILVPFSRFAAVLTVAAALRRPVTAPFDTLVPARRPVRLVTVATPRCPALAYNRRPFPPEYVV